MAAHLAAGDDVGAAEHAAEHGEQVPRERLGGQGDVHAGDGQHAEQRDGGARPRRGRGSRSPSSRPKIAAHTAWEQMSAAAEATEV